MLRPAMMQSLSGPLVEAVVLGALQGVTEFLPVSSDGHLAIARLWFGNDVDLALTVQIHVGTLLATIIVLWDRVRDAVARGLPALIAPARFQESQGGRDALAVLVATVPTAVVALVLEPKVQGWTSSPMVVGFFLFGSAIAVASTRWAPAGELDVPTMGGAALVGLAQGAAVLPGLSRSAVTLAALLWLGVRASRAFELAFLMALPAAAGAVVLEGRHAWRGTPALPPLVVGMAVALFVGIGALVVLRRVMVTGKLAWFAFYLLPVALASVAWGYARPTALAEQIDDASHSADANQALR